MSSPTDQYEAITHGIHVIVQPCYLEEESEPQDNQFVWAYTVQIANRGTETVQLRDRYWRIIDANGHMEEVSGEGVVGEQPTISPGEHYQYTSGCPLPTPSGIMAGNYSMELGDGSMIEVDIPAFSLDLPGARTIVN